MTDHDAFFLSLQSVNTQRGSGYWKFNDSHLLRREFVQMMNMKLESKLEETKNMEAQEKWETIKIFAESVSQTWSREHAEEKSLIISQLYEKVSELQLELDESYSVEKQELLSKTKIDLDELVAEKTLGTIFRTKARWYMEGERNSKYYFALEKSRSNTKTCTVLIDDSNRKVTDQKKILQLQKRFYKKLYAADQKVKFSARNITGIKISPAKQLMLEQEISMEDISSALALMPNSKSP